ncbi:SAM-dependent methyltransferase [uncultured Sphingomonas sp.]|uniref:SAM-dependent methyltransferase n=1 Tax=uncultured Sphingomonas sp. TaxID=158754 RepID=UPI0025CDCC61|nr:SAM-dependent methyltransferase [uncultured Sphingomonas sp.]
MANMLEVIVALPRRASVAPAPAPARRESRAALEDPRWCQICSALGDLRRQQRRAVRIVDADCGCGTLLIAAVRHARALGFTAIEGRGIDTSPALVGRACAAASRLDDRSIGLSFEVADPTRALASETDFPADILLWHDDRGADDHRGEASVRAAARLVIGDQPAHGVTGIAA